ncbi:MAG: hypothetical protein EOM53_00050 [Alphaproteobacteria bacterium]|nr:hypothetical protein [Alphaproteobacteria bacterium]
MIKLFKFFIFCFCLTGCGNVGNTPNILHNLVYKQNYKEAETLVRSKDFYKGDENTLLRSFEKGRVFFLNKKYYQALKSFEEGDNLLEKFYTKSISKGISSNLTGDGLSTYKGENFELSQLKFYLSLTHYKLSHQGFYEAFTDEKGKLIDKKILSSKEKHRHLEQAKSILRSWNSLQEKFKKTDDKKAFTQDMLSKFYGGTIHSLFDKSSDQQTAKILYRNVKNLSKAYKIYPSVQGEHLKNILNFQKEKEKALSSGPKNNLEILFFSGLIEQKRAETVSFPLHLMSLDASFVALMMGNPKGLFYFEIPVVDKPLPAPFYTLKISKMQKGKKTTVLKKPLVLTLPLSEIAYQTYLNQRAGMIAKKGARLAAKYVTALLVSQSIARQNKGQNNFQARLSFLLAAKSISTSEYADIRSWVSLPQNIYEQSAALKKGKYILEIFNNSSKIYSRDFEIKGKNLKLIDITLPFLNPLEKGHKK